MAVDFTAGLRHKNATPAPVVQMTAEAMKAGHATAQHPAMRPAMESATNKPQPVGTEDPASKRTVIQPTDNPATNQALATSEMPAFESRLQKAIAGIQGAQVVATRDYKKPDRLGEKINQEAQPAETIADYGAAQVSVDSPKAKDAVIAAVRKEFPVVKEKDLFEKGDPEYHFYHASLQVQMPSHATIELQIVPKEVMDANPDQHHDYKAAREAKIQGNAKAEAWAAAQGRRKNDAAMAKFTARNQSDIGGENLAPPVKNPATKGDRGKSPEQTAEAAQASPAVITKGSSIVHHDGTAGTVQWAMGGKVRMKTLDGARRDVNLKETTPIPDVEKTKGGWIGVDLDKTIATKQGPEGPSTIGAPIPAMIDRVKKMLAEGKDVRVFTARISGPNQETERKAINTFCQANFGRKLPMTDKKDDHMLEMYDDRARQVEPNTGQIVGDKPDFRAGLKPKEKQS